MNPLEIPTGANASRIRYALRAWLIAAAPSLLGFLALVAIGVDSLRPPAGALEVSTAVYSILAAPLLETTLMMPVASLLSLLVPGRRRVQILLLAATCALAHKLGGGWEQVLASFWPFLIYSVTLTSWLKRSAFDAFSTTALVHALYNATFFGVGGLGALIAGRGG